MEVGVDGVEESINRSERSRAALWQKNWARNWWMASCCRSSRKAKIKSS